MAIVLDQVTKTYGDLKVLDKLSLTFPDTGIIGLFGPSGCGKTTLIHLIAGLQQADSGSIHNIKAHSVSMVFQEDRLLPWMTAGDNLNLIYNDISKTKLWLERLQIEHQQDAYPDELSGGMKRRLALARALGFKADLLLLDEPFKGLDIKLKHQIYPYVKQCGSEKLVILVTHDPSEIMGLADFIWSAGGPPLTLKKIDHDLFSKHWLQTDADFV